MAAAIIYLLRQVSTSGWGSQRTPRVFIAAITGFALGGGLELALACDLRFAADGNYKIGLPEIGLGLFRGSGGTQRLPRIMGLLGAIDSIVTGRTFSPHEAREFKLADRRLPDAQACRSATFEYAKKLATGPVDAIGHAKIAACLGFNATLDSGLAIEREAITHVFASAVADEGIAAFSAKQTPIYQRSQR